MTGKYPIYSRDTLIGSSNFEWSDPSMGVQSGLFYPEAGYAAIAHIYQECTGLPSLTPSLDPDEHRRIEQRLEELRAMNRALELRAESPDGQVMETAFVDISDYSVELPDDDDAHEVTLWFADGDWYRRFFPYPDAASQDRP